MIVDVIPLKEKIMLRLPQTPFFVLVALLLSGCTSKRDVNVVVILKTSDVTISVDRVHFTSAGASMGMTARPPKCEADGSIEHDHLIDSPDGNFVIIDLLKNGEPYRSEIYQLDSNVLSAIGNQSGWVRPDGVADGEKYLNSRLLKQPESFTPTDEKIEYHTRIRYDVAKPYSY